MKNINLAELNIDQDMFMNKIIKDLGQGVQINSSNAQQTNLTKVWTDSPGWQFVVIGLTKTDKLDTLFAVEIQSTGQSKSFMRMKINLQVNEPSISFQKLAQAFAQVEDISIEEAQIFTENYFRSTFNRTLTSELFDELSHDKNYFNWLIY